MNTALRFVAPLALMISGTLLARDAGAQQHPTPEAFVGTFMPHGLDGRAYVDDHIGLIRAALQGCYESTLSSTPSLEGLMLMRVYVASDGAIEDVDIVQNRTGSGELAQCVESAVAAVPMRPSNRDNVSITVPVTFRMRQSAREIASTDAQAMAARR